MKELPDLDLTPLSITPRVKETVDKDTSESEKSDKKGGKEKKKKKLWDGSWRKNKLKKPNSVAVLFLRNNGKAIQYEMETRKGFFELQGKTYHEDNDCMYQINLDGAVRPLAVICEWSLVPVGKQGWYSANDGEGRLEFMIRKFAEFQDYAIRGIRNAELVKMGESNKSPMNARTVILLIVAGIIGIAVLFGSGII